MLPIKTSSTIIILVLLICFSTNSAISQVLEGNSDRFHIAAENENETFQVCGLISGKEYDVFFNKENVNLGSAQKSTIEVTSSCISFPIPFIGDGIVSVTCNNCPQQAAALNNNLIDLPIFTFPNSNADDLVNNFLFAGSCIEATNAQYLGNPISMGEYSNAENSLELNPGIVLSTGEVFSISSPSYDFANTSTNGFGFDNDLANIANANVNDVISLEFDLVVPNDTVLAFKYSFASEEYCEYAPPNASLFNDVFGFFVSGPGMNGPFSNNAVNIAILPDDSPTMVNGVNPVFNSDLFRANEINCNLFPYAPDDLVFDGFTTPFIASVDLIGGETYHFRLAIGDAGDTAFDSAVFIESVSLPDYYVSFANPSGNNTIYEECLETIEIHIDRGPGVDLNYSIVVPIEIGENSTATEGIDFNTLPNSILIVPGQYTYVLTIQAYSDDLTEGIESLYLDFGTCSDLSLINISDLYPLANTGNIYNDCNSNTYTFEGLTAGGIPPYVETWTVDAGFISGNSVTITADAILTLTSTDFCGDETTFDFYLPYNPDAGEPLDLSITSYYQCFNDTYALVSEVIGGVAPYSYEWSNGTIGTNTVVFVEFGEILTVALTVTDDCGNTVTEIIILEDKSNVEILDFIQSSMQECDSTIVTVNYDSGGEDVEISWSNGEIGATAFNLNSGTNSVTITNGIGCMDDATVEVFHAIGFNITGTVTNTSGEGINDGTITVTTIGGTAPFTFVWDEGFFGETITGLASGIYNVTVTDANGCTQTATFVIDPFIVCSLSTNVLITDVSCAGSNDGDATVIVTNGTAPYSYTWSNGENTPTVTGLAAGTYTVTVNDADNCSAVFVVLINESPALYVEISPQDTLLCEGGEVTLSVPNIYDSYLWSNGSTESEITVDATGFYTVQVTDENGCSTFTESSVLIFNGADAYNVTGSTDVMQGDTVTYTAETTTAIGDQLFWYVPAGGEIIGANDEASVTVVWTETGNFNLALGIVSAAGCFPDGLAIVVNVGDVINAVGATHLSADIELFPNPVSDILTIKTEMNIQQIRLIDLAGRILRTYSDVNVSRLDMAWLPTGIYFVEMETVEGIWTEKVVKL